LSKKLEKIAWKEFLSLPFRKFRNKHLYSLRWKLANKFGFWWCDYCEEFHSPRTVKKYEGFDGWNCSRSE